MARASAVIGAQVAAVRLPFAEAAIDVDKPADLALVEAILGPARRRVTAMAAALRPFRLAHISDLHIGPLPPVTPRDLLSKRLLGYLSWRSRKQRIHRIEVLAALERDLRASAPDHVVITGDLVNLGLPAEFVQAAAWLRAPGRRRIGSRWCRAITMPMSGSGENGSLAHWADYMTSDGAATPTGRAAAGGFPYLRRRGPLAIIGLSTAIATPPGFATGRLGQAQLDALDRLLADLAGERLLSRAAAASPAACWRLHVAQASHRCAGLPRESSHAGAQI